MRSILLSLLLIAGLASIAGCRAPASDISPSADEVRPPNGPPAIEPAENIDYAELARNVPIVAGGRFAHPAPTQEQLEELLRWVLPRAGKNRDVWFIYARANWKSETGRELNATVYFTPKRESARLRKGVSRHVGLSIARILELEALIAALERLETQPQPVEASQLPEYWQVSLKDHPFAETLEVPDGTLLPFPKPEGLSEQEVIEIVDFIRTNPRQLQQASHRSFSVSQRGFDGARPILSINKSDGVIEVRSGTSEGILSGSGQVIRLMRTGDDTFDVLAIGKWVS